MDTVTLTDAQTRVLAVLTRFARCVGAARTDDLVGFVNTRAASALVELGLATHEVGATGADVFVITANGRARVWADA